jgi:4a-hydroxytetrahydrobiopterin dehydratase
MERTILNSEGLMAELQGLDGWTVYDSQLVKKFKFGNFAEALGFVNRVGELAEAADHHPDIKFGWGYAEISLTTHDRGGITETDVALAANIDRIQE